MSKLGMTHGRPVELQVISRADAMALGLKRYFTGEPCKRGHVAARLVNDCGCVECANYTKRCNPKRRERDRKYNTQNRERRRQNDILRYHEVDAGHYAMILAGQHGGCALCHRDLSALPTKLVHVDHDHATGLVRGILCSNCNSGLGLLDDDPKLLARAIEYVLEFRMLAEICPSNRKDLSHENPSFCKRKRVAAY